MSYSLKVLYSGSTGNAAVLTDGDGYVPVSEIRCDAYPNMLAVSVPLEGDGSITLTDYASAGKDWNNGGKMAVWLLTD